MGMTHKDVVPYKAWMPMKLVPLHDLRSAFNRVFAAELVVYQAG